MVALCGARALARRRPPRRWGATWQRNCWPGVGRRCWKQAGPPRCRTMPEPAPPNALPLQGRRIAVTRAHDQAGDLLARLRELGAAPLECPAIAIVPPASYAPLDAALAQIDRYGWIIFTSVNGVAAFRDRLAHAGRDAG